MLSLIFSDVDGKLSELELIPPRNDGTYSSHCKGIVTSKTHVFDNDYPWVLPFFFGNLTTECSVLTGPQDIPMALSVVDTIYNLGGFTFWKGSHYTARLHHNGRWFDYDALATPPLQPITGLIAPVQIALIIALQGMNEIYISSHINLILLSTRIVVNYSCKLIVLTMVSCINLKDKIALHSYGTLN